MFIIRAIKDSKTKSVSNYDDKNEEKNYLARI